MFREARQRSTKKQLEKDRLDPLKSHKPEPPVSGPGEPCWGFLFFLFFFFFFFYTVFFRSCLYFFKILAAVGSRPRL